MSSIPRDENQERDVIDANGDTHEPSHDKTQDDETKISLDQKLNEEQNKEESDEKTADEETSDKHVVLSPTRRIRATHIIYKANAHQGQEPQQR